MLTKRSSRKAGRTVAQDREQALSPIKERPAGRRPETQQRHQDIKSVDSLQENIDFLRLWIKYMLFDLEATRRENNYLRKMLEQDPGQNKDSKGGE